MVRRDVVVAALALVFSVTAAYESAKLPLGTIHKPGEGFFPFWISAVLFLLATVPFVSSADITSKHWPTGLRPDREGGRAPRRPGCLHFPARSPRLSALHLSPCPVYVARDRTAKVDSGSQYGGDHGGRFVCRLCYLVECSAASGTAVALGAWRKALHRSNGSSGSSRSKRLKLSAAVERSEAIEQLEQLELG